MGSEMCIRDSVMENGAIVEQGSHNELLAQKGAYWRLYNAQFEGAIEDEDDVSVPTVPLAPPPTTAQIVVDALAESEDAVE